MEQFVDRTSQSQIATCIFNIKKQCMRAKCMKKNPQGLSDENRDDVEKQKNVLDYHQARQSIAMTYDRGYDDSGYERVIHKLS